MRRASLILCVFLAGCSLPPGQGAGTATPSPTPVARDVHSLQKPFEVSLHVEKDRFELGQAVRLTYTIVGPEKAELNFPPAEKFDLKPFEVRDAAAVTLPGSDQRRTWEYRVKITSYETGNLTLPEAVLPVRPAPDAPNQDLKLPGMPFEVARVPMGKNDKPDDIRDAKKQFLFGIPILVVLAAILTVLVASLVVWQVGRWLFRPVKAPAPPPLAPYPWALQQLAELTSQRLDQQGQWEAFYDQLTHVLRFYLGWRFQMPLLEQTTSEILRSLKLSDKHHGPAKELLECADMVKFARSYPGLEKSEKHLEFARRLVEENAPPEVVAPKEAAEEPQ